MATIEHLIRFSELLERLRTVERTILAPGKDRSENDVEHSYMLAMLAWYIISAERLTLDVSKALMYCLAHDLVEAYAGDTYFLKNSPEEKSEKRRKEHEAFERIKSEFPDFPDLIHSIEAYEGRVDDESKFVYALDKLQPVLAIYLDRGRSFHKFDLSFDELIANKKGKFDYFPVVETYWQQFIEILAKNKSELFPRP